MVWDNQENDNYDFIFLTIDFEILGQKYTRKDRKCTLIFFKSFNLYIHLLLYLTEAEDTKRPMYLQIIHVHSI